MKEIIKLTCDEVSSFQKDIYAFYYAHKRSLPWRNTQNPYHILVSEMMLQQTQVQRVFEKYERFIVAFPDVSSLNSAPLQKVLEVWQGLGYNRRALYLKRTALKIVEDFDGAIPSSIEVLRNLPGVGRATASAICAFAFNRPVVFIETNIRSVFIHFFFQENTGVKDNEILPLVEQTLDTTNPREWYYALMDYGVMLKKNHPNPGTKSAHYQKQSPFENSDRQIRGMILRILTGNSGISESDLLRELRAAPGRVKKILDQLEKEGFIIQHDEKFSIKDTPY